MNYHDLMSAIEENPYSEDGWCHGYLHDSPDVHVFTLKRELNIRIVVYGTDNEPYNEQWAKSHADPSAHAVDYEIYYGASLVEAMFLVGVDGMRAMIPPPEAGTAVISRRMYAIARALDTQSNVDDYIRRSGLTVAP